MSNDKRKDIKVNNRISDQDTALLISDLHNARATVLNPFNKLSKAVSK